MDRSRRLALLVVLLNSLLGLLIAHRWAELSRAWSAYDARRDAWELLHTGLVPPPSGAPE